MFEHWPMMLLYVVVMGGFAYGLIRFCLKAL
jgi:hypothetical protein